MVFCTFKIRYQISTFEEIKVHPHHPIRRNLKTIWDIRRTNQLFRSAITTAGNKKDKPYDLIKNQKQNRFYEETISPDCPSFLFLVF
jgi:hypothetical protein